MGCDLERIGRLRLDLAERFFCREEYEAVLMRETEEERRDCFFRYWVLKESFIKATGRGMALPLNSFSIRLESRRSLEDSRRSIPADITTESFLSEISHIRWRSVQQMKKLIQRFIWG